MNAALREQAHALESVFLNQLFQAMRASVPRAEDGEDGAAALFDSWLDERMAQVAAEHSTRGPGEAMLRQLAPHPGDRP
jgi:Rod binding domain-containing protein